MSLTYPFSYSYKACFGAAKTLKLVNIPYGYASLPDDFFAPESDFSHLQGKAKVDSSAV